MLSSGTAFLILVFLDNEERFSGKLLALRDIVKDKTEQVLKKHQNSRKAIIYALSIAEDCVDLTQLSLMHRQKHNNTQVGY